MQFVRTRAVSTLSPLAFPNTEALTDMHGLYASLLCVLLDTQEQQYAAHVAYAAAVAAGAPPQLPEGTAPPPPAPPPPLCNYEALQLWILK